MKKYLCVFTGAPDAMATWQALPDAERQRRQAQGVAAWQRWAEQHAARIVDMGGPLGKTRRITSAGVNDIRNNLSAYVVVRAESQEAAASLFLEHPHFSIFPGDGVEVMEILPIPAG